MDEQHLGTTLTTLTLTYRERRAIAASLTLSATMMEALDDLDGARDTLKLWERVSPDWGGE